MADKKILTGIIRRLDRVISLLDNCIDMGEMNESTRRRLIEMLHTSISEIYSAGKQDESTNDKPAPVAEIVTPKKQVVAKTYEREPEQAVVEEETVVIEQAIVKEANKEPSEVVEKLEKDAHDFVNKQVQEIELGDQLEDDMLIELESPTSLDYLKTEEENEPELVVEVIAEQEKTQIEEEKLAKEKAQLAELRNQLEEERKRMEEELLSWQKERLKRETEMKAAEQLLVALEAETQKRKAAAREAAIVSPPPVVALVEPVVPPVEPKKAVVISPPVDNTINSNSSNTKTISDKLSEKRQSIQDTSSLDDLRRLGITPIADLTKAIGINDKFQFIKELFGGDSDKYTDTIRILNNFDSLTEALSHIDTYFNWDKNNDTVKRIILLVRRRYMN
ncbi:MAG: hypothetical protein LBL90_02065 [Prevotellaceae bacterium]|jgi:hypothetical protein|nr:hypothetical protein [Prevotellaceae bacterium]